VASRNRSKQQTLGTWSTREDTPSSGDDTDDTRDDTPGAHDDRSDETAVKRRVRPVVDEEGPDEQSPTRADERAPRAAELPESVPAGRAAAGEWFLAKGLVKCDRSSFRQYGPWWCPVCERWTATSYRCSHRDCMADIWNRNRENPEMAGDSERRFDPAVGE